MSQLLEFYREEATDAEGRCLAEILAWSDDEFESVHDFVQWLFPLPDPSRFNPDAPLLSEADIAAFRGDPLLQANSLKAFQRFLAYLGLASAADGKVAEGPNFAARVPDVWAYPNHNWLRITRVLRSLRLLGLEARARALYDRLDIMYSSRRFPIGDDTFRYWVDAVEGQPFHG